MPRKQKQKKAAAKPKARGRPETRVLNLRVSPEEAARAVFSAVAPPDPSKRKRR